MSDITHYARARKWLDDPATTIPDDVRGQINASLAISTAQRETEKTISRFADRLADRISQLSIETTRALASLVRDRYTEVDNGLFVNAAHVTVIEPADGGSIIHTAGDAKVDVSARPSKVAAALAGHRPLAAEVDI